MKSHIPTNHDHFVFITFLAFGQQLTKEETTKKGTVSMSVLKSYLMAGNFWIFGVIIFCFLNRFVARVWYSWSLSQWTNDAEQALGSESSETQSSAFGRLASLNNHYILVQGLLVLYETMAYLTVCCIWVFYGRRASAKIQRKFITLITFAKSCFFDTFVSFILYILLTVVCRHFLMTRL